MDPDASSLSAARRNLVLISIGIILFTLGKASLGDGTGKATLSFFGGDLTFDKPDVLIVFAWIMFGWFLLRFWQFSKHKIDWNTYTEEMFISKLMQRWYREKSLGHQPGDKYKFAKEKQLVWGDWKWRTSGEGPKEYIIPKREILKKLKLFFYVAITTEYFGQFYFPYLLAIFALAVTLAVTLY